MRKFIFIVLILLVYTRANAGKEWAMEFPSGTALECYTPNNPPPSGNGTGNLSATPFALDQILYGVNATLGRGSSSLTWNDTIKKLNLTGNMSINGGFLKVGDGTTGGTSGVIINYDANTSTAALLIGTTDKTYGIYQAGNKPNIFEGVINSIGGIFANVTVNADPYGAGWENDYHVAPKHDIWTKIKDLAGGHDAVTGTNTSDIDILVTGQDLNLTINTTLKQTWNEKGTSNVTVNNTAYGAGWNGVATETPSQDAVYDQMELKLAITGTGGGLTATNGGNISADTVTGSQINEHTLSIKNLTKSVSIYNLTTSHDPILWKQPKAATLTAIDMAVVGGTSAALMFEVCDASAANCVGANATAWTVNAGVATITTFTNAAIGAGNWTKMNTTAVTGAVSNAVMTIKFNED